MSTPSFEDIWLAWKEQRQARFDRLVHEEMARREKARHDPEAAALDYQREHPRMKPGLWGWIHFQWLCLRKYCRKGLERKIDLDVERRLKKRRDAAEFLKTDAGRKELEELDYSFEVAREMRARAEMEKRQSGQDPQ